MLGGLGAKEKKLVPSSQQGGSAGSTMGRRANAEREEAGEGCTFHWQQNGEEIQLRFPVDEPIAKKDVSVQFRRCSLNVSVRNTALIDGSLAGAVDVDACTWCVAPGGLELQ